MELQPNPNNIQLCEEKYEEYKQLYQNDSKSLIDYYHDYQIKLTKTNKPNQRSINKVLALIKHFDDLIKAKKDENVEKSNNHSNPSSDSQEEIEKLKKELEEAKKQIEEQQKQLEQLTNSSNPEKQEDSLNNVSISNIPDAPPPPKLSANKAFKQRNIYGENEFKINNNDSFNNVSNSKFQLNHNGLSYDEWKEKKNQISSLIKYLDSNNNEWEIDFELLGNDTLKELKPYLLKWFNEKIGPLAKPNHYIFTYRVNGEWHSVPFNPDIWKTLKENLEKGTLFYEVDDIPFWEYDKDNLAKLPQWSLFDYLRIHLPKNYNNPNKRKINYNKTGGNFFEYLIDSNINPIILEQLKRYQIFDSLTIKTKDDKGKEKEIQRPELNDCCFIYALFQTGYFTDEELNKARIIINDRYLSHQNIQDLCDYLQIKVIVHKHDPEAKGNHETRINKITKNGQKLNYYGIENPPNGKIIELYLFKDHYFLKEKTKITSDYIYNMKTIPNDYYNRRFNKNSWYVDESRGLNSLKLILTLMNQNLFKPITLATASILKTTLYDEIKDKDYPLEITCEKKLLRLIKSYKSNKSSKKSKKKNQIEDNEVDKEEEEIIEETPETEYYYADFECDVSKIFHVPFMVVIQKAGDFNNYQAFYGKDCGKYLLDYLPDNSICYFHNLGYDWCMFKSFAKIEKVIRKGTKIYSATVNYFKKKLIFKDSLPIFQCKLSELPERFGIKDIQKELFPYNYYTLERLEKNIGIIEGVGKNEKRPWTEEDYKIFNQNIDLIPNCRISSNSFNMYKYAEFYCLQDVKILNKTFEKLCQDFKQPPFNLDVRRFLTMPQLANEFFRQTVYIPNGNLYEVGGYVREFLRKGIYGGRCMCAYNKKWHIKKEISDFDAVSLYPSAMNRLWTVEGKPEVLTVPNQNEVFNSIPPFLEKYNTSEKGIGAYVIEIKILKANKHYAFPLIIKKDKQGNNYDDFIKENEPVIMVVDNILLEDLINFQQIEFQIIKGYVWNGKRDYKIREVIKTVFEQRLKYKKEKNPLEQLFKLIMNSAYGKTIQNPVETDYIFKSTIKTDENLPSDLEKYIYSNYNKICEIITIDEKQACVKIKKAINNAFNFSLIGLQILSMSKRIMNEVMCLGFDIKCHIYYQDTDSIHIEVEDLPKLVKAFEEKYKRPLIGKNMGQFHSDFPTINHHDEIPKSIESYFLMKKMYIDKLTDSTGEIDYMKRGKGITQQAIDYLAQEKQGLMNVYKSIFEGNEETFDLTKGQPCFKMLSDFSIFTLDRFKIKVKTTYEEGLRDKYFEY